MTTTDDRDVSATTHRRVAPERRTHQERRLLSLLTPTGRLTLGNYLGALKQMAVQQDGQQDGQLDGAECFYGIADLHALTVPRDPAAVRERTAEMLRLCLAAGIDPDRATLFVQSHVSAHSELAYLLECTASMGELSRMTQFKEKGRGQSDTRVSLFTYPTLMAADILLYRATEVPVGDDQRQHVELTRDLAIRFNNRYAEVFAVPEIVTPPRGARVMDLQDPHIKMSKSREAGAGSIYLLDSPDAARRKIMRAVTDSGTDVRYDPDAKPGVGNLLELLSACTDGAPPQQLVQRFTSYGGLKSAVADAVVATLEPLQHAYAEIDPGAVQELARRGAQRAREAAVPTLHAAQAAIGLR